MLPPEPSAGERRTLTLHEWDQWLLGSWLQTEREHPWSTADGRSRPQAHTDLTEDGTPGSSPSPPYSCLRLQAVLRPQRGCGAEDGKSRVLSASLGQK